MVKIIRGLLTLLLCYGAYTETGIFTAISFVLIFLGIEIIVDSQKRILLLMK